MCPTLQEQIFVETWRWITEEADRGLRLDLFLSQQDISLTRSRIKKLIDGGLVEVEGEPAKPSRKLRPKESIVLRVPPVKPLSLIAEEIPLDICFEDSSLIVVNKPRGLVVHPAPGHPSGTLINAILYHAQTRGGDPLRPGIVHRLDKDTSGLLVVAKTEQAHAVLARQFHEHSIERRYQVLVSGNPPDSGEWRTLHGRHPRDRRRFTSRVTKGRNALSLFETQEHFRQAARLAVTLHTGRTHQVRVHCHDHGFPVLGDPVYGPRKLSPLLRQIHTALDGQALHAERLAFDHPETGRRLNFLAPLPPVFQHALDQLRQIID